MKKQTTLGELPEIYENFVKEAISKAGNVTKEKIQSKMKSQNTIYETRVVNGKPMLQKRTPLFLGHRESHTVDGGKPIANPQRNSDFMIKSTMIERKDNPIVVVGGAKKTTFERKFRNGTVLSERIKVGAVSSRTVYILHRMNSGIITGDYPIRSKLTDKVAEKRNFMQRGEKSASIAKYVNEALSRMGSKL